MVFVETVEIIPHHIENMPFDGLLAVHLVAQQFQLEEEKFLIFQSARSLLDFNVVGWQVNLVIGVATRNESVFLDECLGQRLGDVFVDLLQDEFLQFGDGASAKAVVFHLLGGVIHTLQSLADERVLGVVFFDFGVDEVEIVIEFGSLAKQYIFHARLEAVLDPFQSSEPHHFDAARLVAEKTRGPCGPRCPDEFDIGNGTNKLVIHGVVVDVSHLLDLAAVDVTERKLVEHILIGGHTQFLLEDLGLLRSDALQIGDARLQQVHFHGTKIRNFREIWCTISLFSYFCTAKTVVTDTYFCSRIVNNMEQIIERKQLIYELLSKRRNGKVKIITGIRRCGKSFLLSTLYKNHLLEEGVSEDCFVEIALDKKSNVKYRNPNLLFEYVVGKTQNLDKQYYVFIDEIQLSFKIKNAEIDENLVPEEDRDLLYTTFYDILNDLAARKNLDVYVTGSNSKMLSKDIVTNFRDRGSEIKVYPLSFKEYYPVSGLEKAEAFEEYLIYGGMPLAVLEPDENEKRKYLKGLFKNVYIKDIVERYKIKDDELLSALVDSLSSSVGSLTNPHNLANAAGSLMHRNTSDHTIKNHLDYLEDAYLFVGAKRYDVKGKKYFENTQKYYAMDLGLRNARLNFRQQERSHLMENLVFIELLRRGYSVDVGVVELTKVVDGKRQKSQYEIDFVVNTGKEKLYIQSALNVDSEEKRNQETFSLKNSGDFFRKIVILDGSVKPWIDEEGITYIGVIPFLLEN